MHKFPFNRRKFLHKTLLAILAVAFAKRSYSATHNTSSKIIDAHCHAGKGLNYGIAGDGHAPWTKFNDPEETLRKMEEVGIDQTIIFPINNRTYKAANEEIAGFVKKWPNKLIGFAKHDAKTEAGKIRNLLKHEVNELGLKGLKLHGVPSQEMMDAAEELSIPILFHPPEVDICHEAIESHPKANFILAHLGSFGSRKWTEHLRAIEATKRHPNLFLETSSVVFFLYLERAARELPHHKLIFGTDGPLVDSRIELQKIRMLKLDPDHERKVLGDNIQQLLGGSYK
ncbi:MAG: amidohydrolase family protein [Verrucomicrobia bacterium]|nr:amidohydrolase family protein [Verrucomicrobiota bacterium]MDA1065800.1 amidohydrolase family protein [Verrucomicrobiota bacterium]